MELIVRYGEREEKVAIEGHGETFRVRVGETIYEVDAHTSDGVVRSLLIAGRQHEVAVMPRERGVYAVSSGGDLSTVEVRDPLAHLAQKAHQEAGGGGVLRVGAYMPGRVVEVLVEEGQEVVAGQGVVVLEAMKMENEIQAERAGVVRTLFVAAGEAVEGGDPLFELE